MPSTTAAAPPAPPRGVAVEDGVRDAREELGESLRDALRARADRLEHAPAAFGAALRAAARARRSSGTGASRPRSCTVRATLHRVQRKSWPQSRHRRNGAKPRRGCSRIACSPAREHLAQALEQRRARRAGTPFSSGRAVSRRRSTISTRGSGREAIRSGQRQVREPSPRRGVAGLHRGRRRAEDERRAVLLRPQRDGLAGVVARRLALLVGGVVLLVDDEEARVGDGSEGRRARADHRPRRSRADAVPGLGPLALGERRVQHGRVLGELPPRAPGRRRASARSRARARRRRGRRRARPGSRAGRPRSCRCPSRPRGAPGSSGARGSRRRSPRWRPPARRSASNARRPRRARVGRSRGAPARRSAGGPFASRPRRTAVAAPGRGADLGARWPAGRGASRKREHVAPLAAAAERARRASSPRTRAEVVGDLDPGAARSRARETGADPAALLEGAHRRRAARGPRPAARVTRTASPPDEPLEDRRARPARAAPSAERPLLRDAVPDRPGRGQPRGQTRSSGPPRSTRRTVRATRAAVASSSGGQTGSSSSTSSSVAERARRGSSRGPPTTTPVSTRSPKGTRTRLPGAGTRLARRARRR